jgi:uncharacterized membrane protein YedE/YeeE
MTTSFTPGPALLGGALIGLAAAVLVLANGRVMGISGILGGLLTPAREEVAWRVVFLVGLVLGVLAVAGLHTPASVVALDAPWPLLVAGGLAVGFGTRLGNGCTSGHGVCGIARGSPRSLAATLVFFAVALGTVFISRHVVGG